MDKLSATSKIIKVQSSSYQSKATDNLDITKTEFKNCFIVQCFKEYITITYGIADSKL